jgi:asparagine N-glycosylation enzyme membrane subunit Stt3
MKKVLLLTAIMFSFNIIFSQTNSTIDYFNWSNPSTFKLSPSPTIQGYGFYSDSLSKILDGKTFYIHNDEYYCIESWADYYYWFTKEYRHIFENPQLYEYYYWSNDDYGMASYIASNKYLGKHYPSSIQIAFGDKAVENNRLSTSNYNTEKSDKEIKQLNKQLQSSNEKSRIDKENKQTNTTPHVFQRDDFRKTELKNNEHRIEVQEKSHSSSSKKSIK